MQERRTLILSGGGEIPTTTGVYVMHSNGSIEEVTVTGTPSTTKTNNACSNPTGDCTATNVSSTDVGIIVVDSDLDTAFMLTSNSSGALAIGIPWFGSQGNNQSGGTQSISMNYDGHSQTTVYAAIGSPARTTARNLHKSGQTGVVNTNNIATAAIAAGYTETQCAALYCKNRSKTLPDGKIATGYLISAAEMILINDNIYVINAALTALGGILFNCRATGYKDGSYYYSLFWTSNEYGPSNAYYWRWSSKYSLPYLYNPNKDAKGLACCVRVCYNLKDLT